MLRLLNTFMRQACLAGWLRLFGAALLASGLVLLPVLAEAATITNTAQANFSTPGGAVNLNSNTTSLVGLPAPTPAVVTFHQYAPNTAGSAPLPFDGGSYDAGGGSFVPLPTPVSLDGTPISLNAPVGVYPTGIYHIKDPVFITLADGNRNIDPSVREIIEVTVTTSTGDREILRMQETGPNTGVFAAVIPTLDPTSPVAHNDGHLSVGTNTRLTVDYQDPIYPDDVSKSAALVDPFGFVFDSTSGAPLNGATVLMLNADTGQPAVVFGDDGISSFPATVITGGTVSDSSGQVYNLPTGGFRFPFVRPGNYRFEVTPPVGFTVPSTVAATNMPAKPAGGSYAVVKGSYGDVFVIVPGPALNIDIPADPSTGGLFLQKQVSQTQAAAGDFLQYRLQLQNTSAVTATNTRFVDVLPRGMRYQAGSLRLAGKPLPEPQIGADGRTLTFEIGSLNAGAAVEVSYVVLLGAGVTPGEAINIADVSANAGALVARQAQVSVRIREPLFSGRFTIIGRVFEGDCKTPFAEQQGVANARVLMEDGTYVVTDKDGQYHFEGVRPGTHVVQLDTGTLKGLEPVSCIDNTRFAGTPYSQFVDVKGGGLWRADFHVQKPVQPAKPLGEAGIRLQTLEAVQQQSVTTSSAPRQYTFRGRFASGQDVLLPESAGELEQLLAGLKQDRIQRLEIVGHTDSQRLSARAQARFKDNRGLSEARARAIAEFLAPKLGLPAAAISIRGQGADQPLAGNDSAVNMALNRRVDVIVNGSATVGTASSSASERRQHLVEVDSGVVEASNLRVTVMLPEGLGYVPGSATLDGAALEDPSITEGMMVWRLKGGGRNWKRQIGFATLRQAQVSSAGKPAREYTFRGRFASGDAGLLPESLAELARLKDSLSQDGVERLVIVGHTDSQRLSARARTHFADNRALSLARAQTIADALGSALGLAPEQIQAQGLGEAQPVASNANPAGMALNRRVEVKVYGRAGKTTVSGPACAGPQSLRAAASLDTEAAPNVRLPVVENRLDCGAPDAAPAAAASANDSGRNSVVLKPAEAKAEQPAALEDDKAKDKTGSDAASAGADVDWLEQASATTGFLFPAPDHNPRAPALRAVVQHLASQVVELKLNGKPVSGLNFDGVKKDVSRDAAVSIWRGLPLQEGDNVLEARVLDASGKTVAELRRTVHYANTPVRAELVPEQSVLVADGITKPVLAVRLLDRDGRPVRAGITGAIELNAPYRSWEQVVQEQKRQLAGMDRFQPEYLVKGDQGIALIMLEPTTESGTVQLNLNFQTGPTTNRRQELRAWLEPSARDWVMVGFAEGTVGYNTLKDNVQALKDQGVEEGGYSDGKVSFYAKGRVLGKWLLTMAYDTSKTRERQTLLSTIDPNKFYTLYGDGTGQRYDAASQAKLYLKLERGQFYALFGDYETGLTQTQLSRYSRSLNGIKSENAGGPVVFTVFAAETPQNFARDEIQGNGTSGLYRLSQGDIVLNSEKIRIETRDRLRSERIVLTKTLSRHLDYDIDYDAGTIFFRQPILSRDKDFNPNFIVAEYETLGVADKPLNAGGRIGLNLNEGKLQVGLTAIHDKNSNSQTDLGGADLKLKLGKDSELRVEAATSSSDVGVLKPEGAAWLAEYEQHSGRYDLLLYHRRQEPGFGVKQQNASENGQAKTGLEAQVRLNNNWSVQTQAYEQENLGTDVTRDAAMGKLQYSTQQGGVGLGAQVVEDKAGSGLLAGKSARSEQAVASANRWFFNRKLELTAQAETALGGQSGSVDFPDRYLLGAGWALTDNARLIVGQEFTDGDTLDTSTTRAGVQVVPWKGARLDSTLNQSQISEYGPRTFGQFGLTQAVLIDERWGLDFSVDSSHTFNESAKPAIVANPASPIAPGGGTLGVGAIGLTEDFEAYSTGATYRSELWSWNGRAESRDGETTDRYGLTSSFLRQAREGVAFASTLQAFRTEQSVGSSGFLGSLDLSWAWRPLGTQWSLLDRLEFRYEDVEQGTAVAGSGLFGNNSLVARNASTRRIINNFALNHVSREWTGADQQGNLFSRYERSQWSLYYGAKYAQDTYDGRDYSGYTDIIGLEVRHDLKPWLDVGLQASSLNAWTVDQHAYSIGPMIGASPVKNGWITLGYNLRGFTDRDFDAARYTAEGPYLQLRFKFDQNTRLNRFSSEAQGSADKTERQVSGS